MDITKRHIKLIKRLMNRENLFVSYGNPTISYREITQISDMTGELIQVESLSGAERGSPRFVYAVSYEKFKIAGQRIIDEFEKDYGK